MMRRWILPLGAIALVGCQPTTAPPVPPTPVAAPQEAVKPAPSRARSLEITLTVTDPSELKVAEGDRVAAGDVLGDRPRERERLEAKLGQLQRDLSDLQERPTPAAFAPELSPDLAARRAAIARAEAQLAYLETRHRAQRDRVAEVERLSDPSVPITAVAAVLIQEAPSDRQLGKVIAREQTAADQLATELRQATATLEQQRTTLAAEEQRRSLELVEQQSQRAAREQEIRAEMDAIAAELATAEAIRAPFAGTVKAVKWVEMTESELTVELTLEIESQEVARR